MTGSRWLAAVCAAAALAAAGCGGDEEETGGGGGKTAGSARELFANTCGGCHTLAAAETSGQTGPNLDELKPDADRVREAIAEGPGIMPENLYEGAEADQVAQFVAENAGK